MIPLLGAPPAVYAREKAAAAARVRAGAGRHPTSPSPSTSRRPLAGIFGSLNQPGYDAATQIPEQGGAFAAGDVTPPDSTGAIGPNDYFEFVNDTVADYDRTNLSLKAHTDLSTFTNGTSVCDPQIKYDPATSRWFYAAIRCDGTPSANELYVGFSKETNPSNLTTDWCTYSISTTTVLEDYPKLGLDGTHIMVGANEFDGTSGNFNTAKIYVFGEPAAGTITSCPGTLSGNSFGSVGTPLETSLSDTVTTPEPATVADSSGKGYIVAADESGGPFSGIGSHIMVWQATDTPTANGLTALGDPSVKAFSLPANVPQPASSDPLDPLDGRITNAVAANDPAAGGETIWTQHAVLASSGDEVDWFEIIPGSSPSIRQQGVVTDSSGYAWNAAIAPTSSGGAVMQYNAGGPSQLAQIKAQSRIAGAPLGTMNTPITLASSSAADADFSCPSQGSGASACRWGDYSGASVDPTNGNVVWGTNMFNGPVFPIGGGENGAQWATQNFALTATDLPPSASFSSSGSAADSPVAFSATASDPDGTVTSYGWNFGDGATGSGSTATHTYGRAGTFTVTLTVTDDGNQSTQVTHQVTVLDDSPTAAFTFTPASPGTGAKVKFSGSGHDPDGSIVAVLWNFGDGHTGSGASPTHAYGKAATYTVTMAVVDSSNQMAIIQRTIKVAKAKIGKVSVTHKTTTGATLVITVNAPGRLTVGKKKFKFAQPGTKKIKVHGSGIFKVKLKFAPSVGSKSSTAVKVKLP